MQNEAVGPGAGFVYVQTNEPERNRLLAFRRAGDGALTRAGAYETGGVGDGKPHLTSQGSVILTGDGRYLLVTNTASGDLSVFDVGPDGPSLAETVATGRAPKSAAEHAGLIYVLNTGEPSLTGFQLSGQKVQPLADSTRELAAGTDPAQVGFSPDGATLVVTLRGTNAIAFYPVLETGQLGEPRVQPSSGPTPYGFAFTRRGGLVVTEAFGAQAGKAAVSSYRISEGGAALVSRSVGNGRSEICWAVVTSDGRYAFMTNFGDGAVSCYSIGEDGSMTLDQAAAGLAMDGQTGLRDEDLSGDGRFLYAIDADSRRVFGWAVRENGSLSPIGSWEGLPSTVAGLAAS
jgi:6-phosphogluconolactonase